MTTIDIRRTGDLATGHLTPEQRGCRRCDGDGQVFYIDDRNYEVAAPCPDCSGARLLVRRVTRFELPWRLAGMDLDEYDPKTKQQKYSLEACREFVRDYDSEGGRGLLLCGPTGVGKTHLIVGTCKKLIWAGVPCLFTRAESLLHRFKEGYSKRDSQDYRRRLLSVPLLVVDELPELRTDWERQTIGDLVEARYNACKSLIASANKTPDDLDQIFGQRGGRVISRLLHLNRVVVVTGPDHRTEESDVA